MYKVLLADDDKFERDGLKYLTNNFGFSFLITEAKNGEEAFKILQVEDFDFVITDIRMPVMDGLELAAKSLQLKPYIKFVIYSGYSDFEYAKKAIDLEIVNYLVKPVEDAEFYKVMNKVMKLCDEIRLGRGETNRLDANKSMFQNTQDQNVFVVNKVLKIISSEYYKDNLSVEYLAECVFLNSNYLSCLFKKQTGKNLVKAITDIRMEKAKELITGTSMKFVDIAKSVGYLNPSYFTSIFKNYYGVTPAHYREASLK